MYRNVVQNFINQVLNAEREIGYAVKAEFIIANGYDCSQPHKNG